MTAAIILAAGESARLGFLKQTLLYKGKTLLEWAVEAAQKSKCDMVMVVLGANTDKVKPVSGTTTLYNENWGQGMASTIKTAFEHIEKNQNIDTAIIMLCDQPFVNRALLDSMMYKQQQTNKPIVACSYHDTIGVPVLFTRNLFPKLLTLQGKEGAKKILDQHPDDIAVIPFEKGGIDIDTIQDYERLIGSGN
jgi:molybdenum cofactor cytidylyltransferase